MLGNIVKRFEWPLVRKGLPMCVVVVQQPSTNNPVKGPVNGRGAVGPLTGLFLLSEGTKCNCYSRRYIPLLCPELIQLSLVGPGRFLTVSP